MISNHSKVYNFFSEIDYSSFKPGDVSYGVYGVIDPSEAGNKHAMRFWWYQFAIGKVGGWKYYYSRIDKNLKLINILIDNSKKKNCLEI